MMLCGATICVCWGEVTHTHFVELHRTGAVTVISFRWCCSWFPSFFYPLPLFFYPPPPPGPSLFPPQFPPVFQLETYMSEPRRLETRRLRSFSSPADAALSSSFSCISFCSVSPPVGPGLQVGRLVSNMLS